MIPRRPDAKPLPSGDGAPHPKWPPLALALGYVLSYLALDRLSAIQALHGIDITPWNPQFGLEPWPIGRFSWWMTTARCATR